MYFTMGAASITLSSRSTMPAVNLSVLICASSSINVVLHVFG